MSTNKVVMFVLGMTVISSFLLAGLFYATEGRAKTNEAVFNKRAILGAVKNYIPDFDKLTDEQVLSRLTVLVVAKSICELVTRSKKIRTVKNVLL